MSNENRVAVVVDSGCSMRANYREVAELGVNIVPLEVRFYESGDWVPYLDSDLTPRDFYQKMAQSNKLPQTTGAIVGRATVLYESLGKGTDSIVSVHITSRHSVAHESALLAANQVMEANPGLSIGVIDSRLVSVGTWFLAEKAAGLSLEGYPLKDISRLVGETVPKIELMATLDTLDNLVKGGRVPALTGMLGNFLQIKPLIGFVDGQIVQLAKTRTTGKAKQELIRRVTGVTEEIVDLAILHTNNELGARELREDLAGFYPRKIQIYEAGPVLGVHAGVGAVGVALVKK